MMRRARQEQIDDKRHFMAVQAQSERAAFEKVLKEQKRSMEKDLEREQILQQGRRKNNEVIRMQMRRKEEDLIEERRKMFEGTDPSAGKKEEQRSDQDANEK